MAFTILDQGSFTSAGVAVNISLPAAADYFVCKNLTQLATTQNPGRGVQFEWFSNLNAGEAIEWKKTNSTDAMNLVLATTGGFTYYATAPQPGAAVTGTTINQAATAVCTAASHGYSNGDRVRIYSSTGMLQIGGMDFTVSNVATNTFDLAGLDTSGFGAAASAFVVRKLPALDPVMPSALAVTKISKASSAVVTTSVAHTFVVGQLLTLNVPLSMGMVQMSGLTGKVTAVGTYTVTLDIDSSGFTTFAFPASASAGAFASIAPAGCRNIYNVTDEPFHTGQFYPYMQLAAGVQSPAGSASDVIVWQAFKKEA